MLPDEEGMKILEKATAEIEETCRKYGVVLTGGGGCEFWVHHGQWHDRTGDYSVREMQLDKCCML